MASSLYNAGKKVLAQNDWVAGDYRVLLVNASYTPDIDTHVTVTHITNELSGGNYVRKALAGKAITVDNVNDWIGYFADNVTWTLLSSGTPAKAIVYLEGASDALRFLVGWDEFTPTAATGAGYTVRWNNQASNGELFRV